MDDIEPDDMVEGHRDLENAPDGIEDQEAPELHLSSRKTTDEVSPQLSILRQKISQLNALHQYTVKVVESRGLVHETLDKSNKAKDEENPTPLSVS